MAGRDHGSSPVCETVAKLLLADPMTGTRPNAGLLFGFTVGAFEPSSFDQKVSKRTVAEMVSVGVPVRES